MAKVLVNVNVRLVLDTDIEDNMEICDTLDDMDYNFMSKSDDVKIESTEIKGYEIVGENTVPSIEDCLAQMYFDELGRMHP